MPIFRSNSKLNKNYKNITKGDFSSINKSDIHKLDQYGNSILHIAAKKGNVQLIDYLIKLGANIQLTNYDSQTALDIVNSKILKNNKMQNEYTEIAQLLINHTNDNNILLHTPQENPPIIEIIAIDHRTNTHYTISTNQDVMKTEYAQEYKQTHNMTSSVNKANNIPKIKPQVPPKPTKLLQKTFNDSTTSPESKKHFNYKAEWNGIKELLKSCTTFLNDNNIDLIGLEAANGEAL